MTLSSWISAVPIILMSQLSMAQTDMSFFVPEGQIVRVRLQQQISSSNESVGEPVKMEALANVVAAGRIVVKKGAPLTAVIDIAQKKTKRGPGGKVSIHIIDVAMADGEKLALDTVQVESGGGLNAKFYNPLVVTSLALVTPLGSGAAILLLDGKDIVLPQGTELQARVTKTITLDPQKFEAAPASAETAVSISDVQKEKSVTLHIETTAGDGSLWVDGEFRGESPTELEITPGLHLVKVVRDGYKTWQQKVLVNANLSNLLAVLQRKN